MARTNKDHPEYQYLDLLKDLLKNGSDKQEYNTGITLRGAFGRQIRFDLSKGFPLLTTKKMFTRGIIHELLWFIKGDSNIKYLVDNDVHIWDEWPYRDYKKAMESKGKPVMTQEEFIKKIKDDDKFAKKWGDLGNVYGVQWRKWKASDGRIIDQLGWTIDKLKGPTFDRKHFVVSAWNPEYIYEMAAPGKSMALPPCHTFYHFNVRDGKLSCQLYQRSADVFLGVPFNIASYALLTLMVAQVTGYEPGDFVHTFGDVHIYGNHFKQVREQIKRKPRPLPLMKLNPRIKNIDDFKFEDFELVGYDPYPPLKAEVTVVGGYDQNKTALIPRKKDNKKISLIAAVGNNLGIGKDNKLLWKLPEDLKHFKKLTLGHVVIMGRKTYESLGKPLDKRTNIVICKDKNFKADGCLIAGSVEEALRLASLAQGKDEIFIIGGGQVYKQTIGLADKLYLTLVDDSKEADTFFPDYSIFKKVVSEKKGSSGKLKYKFVELEK